jgi:inner membrane protein COX18
MRPQEAQKQLSRELGKKTAALYKEWKISQTTINVLPLVQFPIWIALMEATRNICGVNMGLLRYLNPMPDKDGGSSLDLPGVEPSLASEGAFWFPNLLAGDPTGILPVILGLTIFTNVRLGFPKMTAAELSDQNKFQMWVSTFLWGAQKGLMFMGAWIALTAYTTGMPAGMMLYWIVSSNTAMLQNKFLDKCLFVSKPLEALPKMEVRILKPGEKPPPVKRLLQ